MRRLIGAVVAVDTALLWFSSWLLAGLLVAGVACCVGAAWWLTTWSERVEDRRTP